ncbi:hypothetical protein PSQ20_00155 [Curvibacter sp. RS43]|uniref:hypothetical protein n=1 Tax=Curvibacter microcysteis TaxID=3026419 RepID=UPI00235E87F7|nr:hypothetical protein [Curvibacter sp. RS43]MDD0808735.1 hypothetical protein [Curvibacter sp. RS43]
MVNIESKKLLQACLAVSMNFALAECNIPVPDMETKVSKRNAAGHLVEVKKNKLILYSVDDHKNIQIDIKGVDFVYSAAGGDGNILDLKKGVQVRVWYVGCHAPHKGDPKAAYIEIFSSNPLDLPDSMYLKSSGR